jgi:hypothetical protein
MCAPCMTDDVTGESELLQSGRELKRGEGFENR